MRRDEFVIRATEFSSSATDATGVDANSRSSLTCQVTKRDAWEREALTASTHTFPRQHRSYVRFESVNGLGVHSWALPLMTP